jgi:hypothetical protein
MVRSYGLKPFFVTLTTLGPSITVTSDGVLPRKTPSISMSAPGGVDEIESFAVVGAIVSGFDLA